MDVTSESLSPEQVVARMDEAFARGDIEALLNFYEPNATVVMEPGTLAHGHAELRAFFEKAMGGGGSATQLQTKVFEAEGIALFISRWTFAPAGAEPDASQALIATSVFRKQPDGQWRVLIDNAYGPMVLDS
jgi:uncharacterized protein (TIGR02246 family)